MGRVFPTFSYVFPSFRAMADYTKDKQFSNETDTIHKIRISLTARNVKALEKVCSDLVQGAKDKRLKCKGPVRMPTKKLVITTRLVARVPTPGTDLKCASTSASSICTPHPILSNRSPPSISSQVSLLRSPSTTK